MSRFSLFSIIISVLSLVLASGCADDLRRGSLFDAGAGEAKIGFSVENISLTRAEGEADIESAIDHAYLLFYSEDASLATASPIAAVKAEVSETALTFKMPLTLQADTDYQLVAIANADNYIPEGYGSFAEYLQGWTNAESATRGEMLLYRSERILASDIDCLPMRGVIPEGEPFRFSMQNGAYSVSASLTFRRAVARIDVANIVKEGFTVEGVALCNWRDAVAAATSEGNLGNRLGTVRGVLSDADEDSSDDIFIEMPAADESGIQKLQKSIYCFPSVNYDSYPSDKESTAFIIKAKYGEDDASTYYRVNVGTSGNKSIVKANTKYLVTIQSVKGSGAATAEEAYAAEESPIVLSVVEDWDLDGGSYAMDADGNFIVLSTGRLEFDGKDVANREVKVLTSRGLTWNMEYIPDNEDSAEAFSAAKLSETSLAIGTTGENPEPDALSGRYKFSAQTPQGSGLYVDLIVVQNPSQGDTPPEPVIPGDMPFALIPQSYERVNIDHEKKTIEIDGFDPNIFNSFIDVPFNVYIKESSMNTVNISTTLQWPLEGRISLDSASQYTYCKESFAITGNKGVRLANGTVTTDSNLGKQQISNVTKDATINISVGAMGPDDPAIKRTVTIQANDGETVVYDLTVKPRPCIIDDVVITDTSGDLWLIMDRNIQSFNISEDAKKNIGVDVEGKRHQAYNYSHISNWTNSNHSISIPFKYENESSLFLEDLHSLYLGKETIYKNLSNLAANENSEGSRLYWLKKYSYSGEILRTSPFYEDDDSEFGFRNWVFPSESLFESLMSQLRMSKMRMFLVSKVEVKAGKTLIPVCCYVSYYLDNVGDVSSYSYGYCTSSDGVNANKILIMNIGYEEVKKGIPSEPNSYYSGLSRLVRPLTSDELEEYKNNYLGYGSQPHRLTICHPDTYTSPGWLGF